MFHVQVATDLYFPPSVVTIATSVRDKARNSMNNLDDVSALQQQLQALRDKASNFGKGGGGGEVTSYFCAVSLDAVSCLYG